MLVPAATAVEVEAFFVVLCPETNVIATTAKQALSNLPVRVRELEEELLEVRDILGGLGGIS
jgi:hypothetical protein